MTSLQFALLALTASIGLMALGSLLAIVAISAPPATSPSAIAFNRHWRNATSR